jgi:hypothetical protein
MMDSSREPLGTIELELNANNSNQENNSGRDITFSSTGFTVAGNNNVNGNGDTYIYVAFAGSYSDYITDYNTDGTIDSRVKASDTTGFSIVSYTGAGIGTNSTVGHGLSQAPDFIVVKDRDSGSRGWIVYHSSLGASSKLALESTDAVVSSSAYWTGTEPTSTVFGVGTGGDTNTTDDYIAYCWAEKTGYSKFGSYEGNNTATGPTVTTTFKPALVIIKNADGTGNWNLFDNTRATFPDNDLILRANLSAAEVDGSAEGGDAYEVEFTSNGFIPKASGASSRSQVNGSSTYIYAAFADTRDAAFWLDQSGNDNDWQPENLDHNDTLLDSPTDNYATLNPLMGNSSYVLSDGNLKCSYASASWLGSQLSTMGMTTGQYYWEVDVNSGSSSIRVLLGIESADNNYLGSTHIGNLTNSVSIYSVGTNFYVNGSATTDAEWVIATGDTVMFAYDADNGTLWIGKNGTWWNGATSSEIAAGTTTNAMTTGLDTSLTWLAGCTVRDGGTVTFNFGQQPFKYTPPA